jgi:hypothetical protein
MDQYFHPAYGAIQLAVMGKFRKSGAVKLIEPALMNWDLSGWSNTWRKIVASLDALVAWPRPDFSIGRGVFTEIQDCQRANIPVWIVTNDLEFYRDFRLELLDLDSYRHFAVVLLKKEGCRG